MGPQGCEGALGCTPCLSVPIACSAQCRVGSLRGKEQKIFWLYLAVSVAVHLVVVQRIGHLLGFASSPSQHTAGGEVSLLCQAGSELGDGTACCTFSVLF